MPQGLPKGSKPKTVRTPLWWEFFTIWTSLISKLYSYWFVSYILVDLKIILLVLHAFRAAKSVNFIRVRASLLWVCFIIHISYSLSSVSELNSCCGFHSAGTWCCITGWLASNIWKQHADLIFCISTLKDKTYTLSQNTGHPSLKDAASYPRRMEKLNCTAAKA